MIVYVESNFVLEITLEQEECRYAERILLAAERGQITLVVPSFSVDEPFSTIAQRSRLRRQINNNISEQARQLERSATHAGLVSEIRAVVGKLASLEGHELTRLQDTVDRALRIATLVPLSAAVFSPAVTQPATEPKLFANRNPKDFDVSDIVSLLATHGCELAVTFEDAWKRIAPHAPGA